jgi:23S rRNA pseudouridine1911/1915/1917 synthase
MTPKSILSIIKAVIVTKSSSDSDSESNPDLNLDLEKASFTIDYEQAGQRLDLVLSDYFSDLSRSRVQAWIKNKQVTLNGEVILKPKHKLLGGELIEVIVDLPDHGEWKAVDIDFDVHYEDESLLVINKSAGLVVHPAPGHYDDTLVNGLLFRYPELRKLPRAGIVHRLDRDTTGLMVVARTPESHHHLVEQLQARAFSREYMALVHGQIIAGDTINLPMGRHPVNRKKMAVVKQGKEAITHYRIAEKFDSFTLLNVNLETGRTHQIRVHLSHLKHFLVGDPVYCLKNLKPKGASEELLESLASFERQALHAKKLGLVHPQTGESIEWEAELPEDMLKLLSVIREQND